MKEFEKWKDDNCVKHCNLCHIGVCGDCVGIGTKEDTWRAALEMLSNKLKQIPDPPNCRCLLSVQEIIDEELGNE